MSIPKLKKILIVFALSIIVTFSASATLTIQIQDRSGNPISPVRVQIFPDKISPQSDVEPIKPRKPRTDGLIGFVTNKNGRIKINDLPDGDYTIVASPDLDSGEITESFIIIREIQSPSNVTISIAETVPIKISAISVDETPLMTARVYLRPCKRAIGYLGILNNRGEITTHATPNFYNAVIKGSISLHYVVLENIEISDDLNEIIFDGRNEATANLELDLPDQTVLVLHEVLSTDATHEWIEIVESQIGYDAAYTDIPTIGFNKNAPTLHLKTGLNYQFNLSYVADLDGELYAYELRIDNLNVDQPIVYRIGNRGDLPFKLETWTEKSIFTPDDEITIHFQITDPIGNRMSRLFNYSGARLVFPFAVVRDATGRVIANNSITGELPKDFFQFTFRLPKTATPGNYEIETTLDAKLYGRLIDQINFSVVPIDEHQSPKIENLISPKIVEQDQKIEISAEIRGDKIITPKLSISDLTLSPTRTENDRYFWIIDPLQLISPLNSEIEWNLIADDVQQNGSLQIVKNNTTEVISIESDPPIIFPTSEKIEIVAGTIRKIKLTEQYNGSILTTTNGIGVIDRDRNFYATSIANRTGEIEAFKNGKVETAMIEIVPDQPISLDLSPRDYVRVRAGEQIEFTPIPRDRFGNVNKNLTVVWEIDGKMGEISDGIFSADLIGFGVLKAIYENLIAETKIEVINGKIHEIEIIPSQLDLIAGQIKTLKLIGRNRFGNEIELSPIWSVVGGVGEIVGGKFRATRVGHGKIVANFFDLRTEIEVSVSAGDLRQITTEPFIAYLPISTADRKFKHRFVAHGWDGIGNPVQIPKLKWTVDAAAGEIDNNGLITSIQQISTQTLGNIVINGTVWATSGSAFSGKSVIVIQRSPPKQTTKIIITLKNLDQQIDNFTLSAGETKKFETIGFDQDNQRTQVRPKWTVIGSDGTIDQDGNFTANRPAMVQIVAAENGLTATANVQITAGKLHRIAIHPAFAEPIIGENLTFSVFGFDQLGNQIDLSEFPIYFHSSKNNVIQLDQDGRAVATAIGSTTVHAQIADLTAIAQIFVSGQTTTPKPQISQITQIKFPKSIAPQKIATEVQNLEIFPKRETILNISDIQDFRVMVSDQDVRASWEVIGGIGFIDANGRFTATRLGIGEIRVSIGNVIAVKAISVVRPQISANREFLPPKNPIRWNIINNSETLRSGETTLIIAHGETADGRIFHLKPQWRIDGGGWISADGVFHADRVGDVELSAIVAEYPELPKKQISLTVVPNRPTILQSEPSEILIADQVTPTRISIIATDAHGNLTATPNDLKWSIVGDLGAISADGIFTPNQNSRDRIGEIIAEVPDQNLIARTTIVKTKSTKVNSVRISPTHAKLRSGDTLQFTLTAIDANGDLVDRDGRWRIDAANNFSDLQNILSQNGFLKIERSVKIGSKFSVFGEINGISAIAEVEILPPLIENLELKIETNEITIGDSLTIEVFGIDKNLTKQKLLANDLKWSISPSIADLKIDRENLQLIATETGLAMLTVRHSQTVSAEIQIVIFPKDEIEKLEIIAIEPQTPKIRADQKIRLAAISMPFIDSEKISWHTESGKIEIFDRYVNFHNTEIGSHQITATFKNLTANLTIEILPSELANLKIDPTNVSLLTTDLIYQFDLVGTDLFGNRIKNLTNVKWSKIGEIGEIDQNGKLTLDRKSAQGFVTATIGEIGASANVSVIQKFGELAEIELLAIANSVVVDRSVELQLIGRDREGNRLSEILSAIEFSIHPTNQGEIEIDNGKIFYNAPKRLENKKSRITATTKNLTSNQITIDVLPDKPDRITLVVSDGTFATKAGEEIEILCSVSDRFGNVIPKDQLDQNPIATADLGEIAIKIPPFQFPLIMFSFVSEKVGRSKIKVELGEISATKEIEISQGEITEIRITSENRKIRAGEKIEFRLTTTDQFGNFAENRSNANWKTIGFSDDQTATSITFQPQFQKVGKGRVTAKIEIDRKIYRAETEIEILPNELKKLETEIEPNMISGGKYPLNAIGFDEFENPIVTDPKWSVVGEIGEIDGDQFRATFVGSGEITATVSALSISVPIRVEPLKKQISQNGEVIKSPIGVSVEILEMPRSTEISIELVEKIGTQNAVSISPKRLHISAVITFQLSETEIDQQNLNVHFWEAISESWLPIASRFENGSITANVNHFGTFAVMESDATEIGKTFAIRDVRLIPPIFYAPEIHSLSIAYRIENETPTVEMTIEIFNLRDERVIRLIDRAERRIGENVELWDGKNDLGEIVKNGRYIVLLIGRSGDRTVFEKKILTVFK